MVIIKKKRDKCWQECGEKRTIVYCWWDCKLVQLLWKTVWRFLKKKKKKTETELPEEPASPLLYMPEENEIVTLKRYLYSCVYCSVTEAILTITK